jgi:hypothetical protein
LTEPVIKLLRTIALDPSDTFVFDPVAEPGEWAVSGAFRFWGGDPATLEGKARSAFRSGFLGVQSWGWSTLVQIVEASADDRAAVAELLAQQLVDKLGAPDLLIARRKTAKCARHSAACSREMGRSRGECSRSGRWRTRRSPPSMSIWWA